MIAPRQVLPNLVAGAIAEAGANQAGDMMQVGTSASNSPRTVGAACTAFLRFKVGSLGLSLLS